MKQIVFLFALVYTAQSAVAFLDNKDPYPYVNYWSVQEDFGAEERDINNNCTKSGPLCKTCTELVQCVDIGGGEFIEVPIQTCKEKEFCLADKCSKEPNPECGNADIAFKCQSTGVFPDPLNCHLYHICVKKDDSVTKKDEQIAAKCTDETYGYNPVTTYCDRKLTNNMCPPTPPVPACPKVGHSAAIAGTSIFYVCVFSKDYENGVPNLFMCPHGTKYGTKGCAS